jgi:NAD(P)-dependent dehydrogenase (short-subunit alcohol dehydrogenase family)
MIILITGASSGFGALAARALATAGHLVFGGMRDTEGRNRGKVADAKAFAAQNDAQLSAVELDVTSDESTRHVVESILAAHGRIDCIIHNAGHMVLGPSEAFAPEQLAALYDVNVLGTQRLNRAALPQMRARGDGLVIWVGSSSTRGGTPPYLGPYFAAKAAMDALAVSYAGELARWGIETSIIVPGAFTTGTSHFENAGGPDDQAVADAYATGPYQGIEATINDGLASLEPGDADASSVADAIVRVVGMPHGSRPFRVHIDPSQDGCEVVAAVADRIRAEFLRRIGLTDILAPSPAASLSIERTRS